MCIRDSNYGDMSNYLWLGPQTLTGGGGNPDLDPYRSTNYDFSAESVSYTHLDVYKRQFLVGWKNKADNFGIIVSAQRAIENIRRDGIESYGTVTGRDYAYGAGGGGSIYNRPTDWSVAPNPDGSQPTVPTPCAGTCGSTLLANLGAIGPNSISAHYFEQERKRDTLSLALQFKPHEKLDIEFNATDVKAGYDNISHSMFAFNGNAWNSLMKMTDVTVDGGVITGATFKLSLIHI